MNETSLYCLVARSATPAQALAGSRILCARTDAETGERLLIGEAAPGLLDCADEENFTVVELARGATRVSGHFRPRIFPLELELRVGLLITPSLIPRFEAFLADNPFMAFAAVARRETDGPYIRFTAVLDLSSTVYRDVRHELPTFALRGGPDAQAQTHVETFNEDGQLLTFGELPVARGVIGRAVARVADARSGWTARADATGLLDPTP